MGLIGQLFKQDKRGEQLGSFHPSTIDENWRSKIFGNSETGEKITPATAMQVSTVYAIVGMISEMFAVLDMVPERKTKNGNSVKDPEFYLSSLLTQTANPEMTAFEFKEMMQAHLLLRGNAFAQKLLYISGKNRGKTKYLAPLHPDRMIVRREGLVLAYYYLDENNTEQKIPTDQVLHLRGLMTDGVMGLSPISIASGAIGLAAATEKHGSRLFGKAARPDGALKHPGKLSPDAIANLKASIREQYSGPQNSHGIMVLEDGMEWMQLGLKNDEAQFLETRGFQRQDICAIFRTTEELIFGIGKNAASMDYQTRRFLQFTLGGWLKRWKASLVHQLYTEEDRLTHDLDYNARDFLKGDYLKHAQYCALLRQWGTLSINDTRRELGYSTLDFDEADDYLVPMNMVPTDLLDDVVAKDDSKAEPGGVDTVKNLTNPRSYSAVRAKKTPQNDSINAAFTVIFAEDLRKLRRKEAINIEKTTKRAAREGDLDDVVAWAVKFYAEQSEQIAETFFPSVRALGIARGIADGDAPIREMSRRLAEQYTERAIEQIRGLLDPENGAADVLMTLFDHAEAMKNRTHDAEAREIVNQLTGGENVED